jgi:hypothetical protein
VKINFIIVTYLLLIGNLIAYSGIEFIDTECNLHLSNDVLFTKDINNSTLHKLNITRRIKNTLKESEGYVEKVYSTYYMKKNKYLFHTEQTINSKNISLTIGNSSDIYLKTEHLNIHIGDSLDTIFKKYSIYKRLNGEMFSYLYFKEIDKVGIIIEYIEYGSESNVSKIKIKGFFCVSPNSSN